MSAVLNHPRSFVVFVIETIQDPGFDDMAPQRRSRRFFSLLLVTLLVTPVSAVHACMCFEYPEDLEAAIVLAYGQADAVFLGEVTSIRTVRLPGLKQREVVFSVHTRWKGPGDDSISVRTNIGVIACGYSFRKRKTYLVFAHRDNDLGLYSTSYCDLTGTEAESQLAIGFLDRLLESAEE